MRPPSSKGNPIVFPHGVHQDLLMSQYSLATACRVFHGCCLDVRMLTMTSHELMFPS